MSNADVVRVARVARDHAREAVDRLEHHLARGARGARGVAREVQFLNALDRQAMRAAGNATGRSIAPRHQGLGDRALSRLTGADAAYARAGVLAEFSDDVMLAARLDRDGTGWTWCANHTACAACLDEHGTTYPDAAIFGPMHPSCMCFPEPNSRVGDDVRTLTNTEMGTLLRERGGRDAALGEALLRGTLRREDVRVPLGPQQWRQQPAAGRLPGVPTTPPVTPPEPGPLPPLSPTGPAPAPAPVPAPLVEPTPWSPTMTPEQANSWAQNSVVKEDMFHVTSESAAKAIQEGGFQHSAHGWFGNGNYVADAAHTDHWSYMGSRGAGEPTRLTTRINVTNPLEIVNPQGSFTAMANAGVPSHMSDEFMDIFNAVQRDKSWMDDGWSAAFGNAARERGFDAIKVVFDETLPGYGEFGASWAQGAGYDQWIVLDNQAITVTNAAKVAFPE